MILVTGGAGFIGSQTVRVLQTKGYRVRILDNFSTGKVENLLGLQDVDIINGDIRNYETVLRALKNVTGVIHLAAQVSVQFSIMRPDISYEINNSGFLNVLNGIRMVNTGIRLVFASSAAVYGNQSVMICREDSSPKPISPYALEKHVNEQYAELFRKVYGINSIGLRYFNVYGEGQDPNSQYSGVITKFLSAIQRKECLFIYGDGTQRRDFIHVKDIAAANTKALESNYTGVVNVGTGNSTSLKELLDVIKENLDDDVYVKYKQPRPGDIKDSFCDITLAKDVIGFAPKIDFRDGIKDIIKQLSSNCL